MAETISPKLALLEEYAVVARALGAPHRLMILEQLAQGERGVDALAQKLALSVANTSQHLQHLRRAGLVVSRREGKSVVYRLSDDRTLALLDMLRDFAERNLAEVEKVMRSFYDGAADLEPISRDELAARLAEGSVALLDVRPADEYEMAHVPGAVNMPISTLAAQLGELDPKTEIVAYCRGPYCLYAHQAVAMLRAKGFTAQRMEGGLPEWRADGREVV